MHLAEEGAAGSVHQGPAQVVRRRVSGAGQGSKRLKRRRHRSGTGTRPPVQPAVGFGPLICEVGTCPHESSTQVTVLGDGLGRAAVRGREGAGAGALSPQGPVLPFSFLSRLRVSVQWEPPTVSGVPIQRGSGFR